MTIIQKINAYIKKKYNFFSLLDTKAFRIQKFNPFILISFLIIFSSIFFISSDLITKKKQKDENNFKEIYENSEFSNLKNYFISKINSPYEEIHYVIKNNDTVEKILKKFKIQSDDIRNISLKLKEKKLDNIYSGRKLSIIIKKLEDKSNTIINFIYPIYII